MSDHVKALRDWPDGWPDDERCITRAVAAAAADHIAALEAENRRLRAGLNVGLEMEADQHIDMDLNQMWVTWLDRARTALAPAKQEDEGWARI